MSCKSNLCVLRSSSRYEPKFHATSTPWPTTNRANATCVSYESQVLHTVWCHISGEVAGEIWNWSLLGVNNLSPPRVINFKFLQQLHQKKNNTKWGALAFSYCTQMKDWLCYQFSLTELIYFSKVGRNVLFELGNDRVKNNAKWCYDSFKISCHLPTHQKST